jgi:hypothetical protein
VEPLLDPHSRQLGDADAEHIRAAAKLGDVSILKRYPEYRRKSSPIVTSTGTTLSS